MIIRNKTGIDLYIDGENISSDAEHNSQEMAFQQKVVHSDIGSVEIITEYSRRTIKTFGKLQAYESKSLKDEQGLPIILIEAEEGTPKNPNKRTCLHRTEYGQYDDERTSAIYSEAEHVCSEYIKAFPDVDTGDLILILLVEANYIRACKLAEDARACKLAEEASKSSCNRDCKDCPDKTFDSDSSQSFICDKTGRAVG